MDSRKIHGDFGDDFPQAGQALHSPWYQHYSEQKHDNRPHSHIHSHGNIPQTSCIRVKEMKPQGPSLLPFDNDEQNYDHSRSGLGSFRNEGSIGINQSQVLSQPQHHGWFRGEEQRHSSERKKKRKRDRPQSASSPFSPDASSTPHIHKDVRPAPSPVVIPIPIDNRLTENVLRSQAETSRRIAQEQASMPKFASRVSDTSSSGSSSETESDPTVSDSESDDTSDKDTTSESSSDSDSDDVSAKQQKRSKSDPKTISMRRKESTDRTTSTEESRTDLHSKSNSKVKSKKGESLRSAKKTNPSGSSGQINTELEVSLLASLQSLIPVSVRTHARAVLTQELQARHKNNNNNKNKTDHPLSGMKVNSPGNHHNSHTTDRRDKDRIKNKDTSSDGDRGNRQNTPTSTAITLRAARDLILRLSGQRLLQSSGGGGGGGGGPVNGTLEADLARIANERGKRIQDLERENHGLRAEIGNLR